VPTGAVANDTYVYWSNFGGNTIGRANLDGTGVNQSFITGANHPVGISADDTHIYWANQGSNKSAGRTWTGRTSRRPSSPPVPRPRV